MELLPDELTVSH